MVLALLVIGALPAIASNVIFAEPLNEAFPIVLAVCNVVAVEALPVKLAFIVAGSLRVALADPLTDIAAPVLVPSESAT